MDIELGASIMKQNQNSSWSIALCGVTVALSGVLMLLGSIIPIAMFIAPAAGGVFIAVIAEECGQRYAWTAYAAASLIGLLFVPDKETALFFAVLLGYYPLVKPGFARLRLMVLRVGAKLLLCNGSVLAMYGVLLLFFPGGEIAAELQTAALMLTVVTLLIGNAAFLLFDRALVNLMRVYRMLWQPRLHKMLGRR